MFDEWNIGTDDQRALLGLPEGGDDPFRDLNSKSSKAALHEARERMGILLHIYKCLGTLYPDNREIREQWMRSPIRSIGNQSPVRLVAQRGMNGLSEIASLLDAQMQH